MNITVKHISNDPQYAYRATLHVGSSGRSVYGATAEEAEVKLRKLYDCEGIGAKYPVTTLIPITAHPWSQDKVDVRRKRN